MFFIYYKDFTNRTSCAKCNEIPTNGYGKKVELIAEHKLTEEQFGMSLDELKIWFPTVEIKE